MDNYDEMELNQRLISWQSQINLESNIEDINQNVFHVKQLLINNDRFFIINAYKAIMKRLPDVDGMQHYLNELKSKRKIKILRQLLSSAEGKKNNVKVRGLFFAEILTLFKKLPFIRLLFNFYGKLTFIFKIDNIYDEKLFTVAEIQKELVKLQIENRKIQRHLNKHEKELENLSEFVSYNLDKNSPDWNEFYLQFENQFRGSRESIKEQLQFYIPILQQLNLQEKDMILDIGCGRGEWLELLKEYNFNAIGVDSNQKVIKECSQRNLTVIHEDAIKYLANQASNTLKVITGFHLIEHISLTSLLNLIDEAYRSLQKDGILIFETPNPLNINVSTFAFYLDPTHKKPIPALLIKNILEFKGFKSVEIHQLNKDEELQHIDVSSTIEERFKGPQDYAAIGYKR